MEKYIKRRQQLDRELPHYVDLYAGIHDFVVTYAKNLDTEEKRRQGGTGVGHAKNINELTALWKTKSEGLRKIARDDELDADDCAAIGTFMLEDFDYDRTPRGKVADGYYDRESVAMQIDRGLRVAQGLPPEATPKIPKVRTGKPKEPKL